MTAAVGQMANLVTSGTVPTSALFVPSLYRVGIFLLLSIRWGLGILWYFDKVYVSKPATDLPRRYFFDFFVAFLSTLLFVPMALSIAAPADSVSLVSGWLDRALPQGTVVSTFIWIVAGLLAYDVFWFLLEVARWVLSDTARRVSRKPRRVHITPLRCDVVSAFLKWLRPRDADFGALLYSQRQGRGFRSPARSSYPVL